MFLHCDRVVGAALHGRVVGDDQHLAARDAADAGHDARAGSLAVVHLPRGKRGQLEKRRTLVEQPIDPLAYRELPLLAMALQVSRAAPFARLREPLAQLRHERRHPVAIRRVLGAVCADARLNALHQKESETSSSVSNTSALPAAALLSAD